MKTFFVLLGIGVLVAGTVFLSGLICWLLWNALVPSLFGGPHATYWQGVLLAVALNVIGGLLFRRK
jgi:hypothetical protein